MILIATSIGVVGAVILSNMLSLGPYITGSAPIQISQVASPVTTGCGTLNQTQQTIYFSATELPSGSGFITQSVWYKTGIHLSAPSGSSFNVIENYNITYVGSQQPGANDIQLLYCDQTDGYWRQITPTYLANVKTWTGTVTGTGFILPTSYASTTPVLMTVLQPGNYTVKLWFSSA